MTIGIKDLEDITQGILPNAREPLVKLYTNESTHKYAGFILKYAGIAQKPDDYSKKCGVLRMAVS